MIDAVSRDETTLAVVQDTEALAHGFTSNDDGVVAGGQTCDLELQVGLVRPEPGHTLVGAGGAEGAIDASNVLKPALSRGEVQCIGATTLDEYRKFIEKDGALERRFQTIMVNPPSKEETVEILKGLRDKYEAHHRVQITDDGLEAAVEFSTRYISGRFLPDKAIDVIDEAGSRVRMKTMTRPPDLRDIEKEIESFNKEKEEAVAQQDFERAANLRDQSDQLKKKKDKLHPNDKAKRLLCSCLWP